MSDATGLSHPTIRKGRGELESGGAEHGRFRRPGAGRPGIKQSQPGIKQALEKLVDPVTRGDPESPLRWTCKSRAKLATALSSAGWKVGSTTVGRLLHELGYRLQSVRKSREGASHPDRNAQFEHINSKAEEFLQRGQPVLSVDTKKKELVGDFKNAGREWQPKGDPEKSLVHDFPQDAASRAIPYGIYDMGSNEAWVSVGFDHDTPVFAVASLPHFADETGVRVHVSHFPPGTSKWNKIEHRLFCHITQNWRGKPLRTFETIVDLIGNTRSDAGQRVRAELDEGEYPTGVKTTNAEMDALSLHRNEFHGDWNYEIYPR